RAAGAKGPPGPRRPRASPRTSASACTYPSARCSPSPALSTSCSCEGGSTPGLPASRSFFDHRGPVVGVRPHRVGLRAELGPVGLLHALRALVAELRGGQRHHRAPETAAGQARPVDALLGLEDVDQEVELGAAVLEPGARAAVRGEEKL